VVTVGVMGLIFASVYRWRGSLVAPVAMHFMQDAIGIIVLPLLGRAGS
jgi:membrane protease YdiL (CAAX protease family)